MNETLESILDDIARKLKSRKLNHVSTETGINTQTLGDIREGRMTNPTMKTMSALIQYFKDNK